MKVVTNDCTNITTKKILIEELIWYGLLQYETKYCVLFLLGD